MHTHAYVLTELYIYMICIYTGTHTHLYYMYIHSVTVGNICAYMHAWMHAYTHVAHKSVAHTFLRGPGLFSCLASMLVVLFGETSIHSAGCAACLLPRFFAVWCLAACEGLDFELTLWQPHSQRLYPWPRLSKPWLLQYPSSKLACALQVIESLKDTEWGSALDSTTCHTFSYLLDARTR